MKTIAIVNQKGGCGKTTVSINMASALAELGQRVLLVDMGNDGVTHSNNILSFNEFIICSDKQSILYKLIIFSQGNRNAFRCTICNEQ